MIGDLHNCAKIKVIQLYIQPLSRATFDIYVFIRLHQAVISVVIEILVDMMDSVV